MKDTFTAYHPIINFIYFLTVILCSMFFMHPVFLLISVISAFAYSIYLNGMKAMKFNLLYLLPSMVIVAMINPLFNHRGITILFYFRDNPITLESIVYGVAAGLMFASVILWFSCYNAVMTSDKFIYLFGRIIPASSLIFSMVLRFVPKFKAQITQISNAQKCVGRDVGSGTYLERARHGMKILSIMVTWALENAVETADSMKSRGYGLKGRTSFSIFRFDARDKGILLIMTGFIAVLLMGALCGQNNIQYFPSVKVVDMSGFSILVYSVYAMFSTIPICLNIVEEIKWKHLQ
jgi:energy-coupling factor transport system permease protein